MLEEVLSAIGPTDGETYVDGTFGNGGYTQALLDSADCKVIGLDRDPNVGPRAQELASQYGERFRLIETAFSKMDQLDLDPVDAVVLDIGVSSMQLDQGARGFSFSKPGPLDMRMGADGPSAADAVAELSREDLMRLFRVYGEERNAKRAADLIVRAREEDAITTTDGLAKLIEEGLGRPGGKAGKIHPATRIFQALRIFVNDELGELSRALCAAEAILKPGGRLVVVTFHSLEDRIVKAFLRDRAGEFEGGSRYAPEVVRTGPVPSFELPRRSVVKPSKTEIELNPRSRSAKLRSGVRTDAPAHLCGNTDYPSVIHVRELVS
jgi:16S rRNA (cytosine1402-N4)-methyltransferase